MTALCGILTYLFLGFMGASALARHRNIGGRHARAPTRRGRPRQGVRTAAGKRKKTAFQNSVSTPQREQVEGVTTEQRKEGGQDTSWTQLEPKGNSPVSTGSRTRLLPTTRLSSTKNESQPARLRSLQSVDEMMG